MTTFSISPPTITSDVDYLRDASAGILRENGSVSVLGIFEPHAEPLPPVSITVKVMLSIWCVLLIPWVPFAGLAGMAFDGGATIAALIFV